MGQLMTLQKSCHAQTCKCGKLELISPASAMLSEQPCCLSALAEWHSLGAWSSTPPSDPAQFVWCQLGNGKKQQHPKVTHVTIFWGRLGTVSSADGNVGLLPFSASGTVETTSAHMKQSQCQNHALPSLLKLERNRIPRRKSRDFMVSNKDIYLRAGDMGVFLPLWIPHHTTLFL